MQYKRYHDRQASTIAAKTHSTVNEVIERALQFYSQVVDYEKEGYKIKAVLEKATTFRLKDIVV